MFDFFSVKLFNVKIMLAAAILCLAVQGCQNRADDADSDDRNQKEQTDSTRESAGINGQTETETKAPVSAAKPKKAEFHAQATAKPAPAVKPVNTGPIVNGGFDQWAADGLPASWRVYNGQIAKMTNGNGVQLLPGDGQNIMAVTQKIRSAQPLAGKTVKVVAHGLAREAGALSIQVQYYVGDEAMKGIIKHSGSGKLEEMVGRTKLPANIDESKGVVIALRLEKTAKQPAEVKDLTVSVF